MKIGFYAKLAWTGIRKNKRLYTPYILTCMGMIMMYYIVAFLSVSDVLFGIPVGNVMQSMLEFGCGVMCVFTLIFLFYTNSFLTRRRKKEFGLYNILGMDKWNLARILVWESVIIAGISLGGGLAAGILFSKFAELGMVNILSGEVSFTMSLEPKAVLETMKLFAVVFVLILLDSLRQIHLADPIELLHSEHAGEKPPKANWILALAGAAILGAAYYLAVSIEEPVAAMVWFFVAVAMVIVATYLLFVAGSVTICRLLQKNKNYYYKTNHFVSVSSMVYRMKRNGAGLASICILCTMVLVMLSGTVCLYIGTEDSLRARYPRNINLDAEAGSLDLLESEQTEAVRQLVEQVVEENGQSVEQVQEYRTVEFDGYIEDGRITTDDSESFAFQKRAYTDIWQIFLVPIADYNQLMDQNETLEAGEVLLYTTKLKYDGATITIRDGETLKVKKVVDTFVDNGVDAMQVIPSMYLFVPDLAETAEPLAGLTTERGNPILGMHWLYGFDLDCEDEVQIRIQGQIEDGLGKLGLMENDGSDDAQTEQEVADSVDLEAGNATDGADTNEAADFAVSCAGVARERTGFYGLYGGLFFLGILLGVVFIFAAVLIIYYKQITEGYEDQSKFEIMQKVGMTQRDIKKSINSQVLTVFFLPILTAGVHLAFAFPLMYKILVLFSLTNLKLLVQVTVGCYLMFALFYVIVYRITSKAYYGIVSGAQ